MKKSLIATKNPLIYSGNSGVKRTTITIMKTDKMKTTIIQELTDNYWASHCFSKNSGGIECNRCWGKGIVRKMSFSCEEANCTETFKTKTRLNKHNHDDHTSQVTVSIQNSKSPEYIFILFIN
jgi:hypothetical protein